MVSESPSLRETSRLGPFINEDGDIWVSAKIGGIGKAYKKANEAVYEKCHFVDMETVQVSLHEYDGMGLHYEMDSTDIKECELSTSDNPCTWYERCYHFREFDEYL